MEELLGFKLGLKFNTMSYADLPLPGEEPPKEKTYFDKKKERVEIEGKINEDVNALLAKLKEEKRARKERKRRERLEKKAIEQ